MEEVKDEEDVVGPLAKTLIQVMWDNPDVVAYVMKGREVRK